MPKQFAKWAAVQLHRAILLENLSLAISDDAQMGIEPITAHSLAKQIQLVMEKYTAVLCNCR
jgi:hypothetical protein